MSPCEATDSQHGGHTDCLNQLDLENPGLVKYILCEH